MENVEERVKKCMEILNKMDLGDSINEQSFREYLVFREQYNQLENELEEAYKERDAVHKNWTEEKARYEKELNEKNPDGRYSFKEWEKWNGIHDKAEYLMKKPIQIIIGHEKKIREIEQQMEWFERILREKNEGLDNEQSYTINCLEKRIKRAEQSIRELYAQEEESKKNYETNRAEFDKNLSALWEALDC